MLLPCYIMLFVPEPSVTFSVLHDHVIIVTVTCDITLILTLSLKIRK